VGTQGVGNDGVEAIDDGSFELLGGEGSVASYQPLHEFERRVRARRCFAWFEFELVAASTVQAGDDYVGPLGVSHVHSVSLVVCVLDRVCDQPKLREAASRHVDAQLFAHGALTPITPEYELGLDGGRPTQGVPHRGGHTVGFLGQFNKLVTETESDVLPGSQLFEHRALEVRLREWVLERVTMP